MRIAVFGTGGVGGYFGGRLAQAGEDVVFIARGKHLRALHTHGLKVDSTKGDFILHPVQATDDPAEVGVVDVVLVGVKAWQVSEAAQAHTPYDWTRNVCRSTAKMGSKPPTQLVEVLGTKHVIGGLCGDYQLNCRARSHPPFGCRPLRAVWRTR